MVKKLTEIKDDFPILKQNVNDEALVYLDNAATTQKPKVVLETLKHYYESDNANVYRGVHTLSQRATLDYENARQKVADFINAPIKDDVIFTKGTTQSINWVAQSFGDTVVKKGDEILISEMEHHSNLVPWQQLAKRTGATLKFIHLLPDGQLDMADAKKQMSDHTKILSITHVSNVLGVINPLRELEQMIHAHGGYFVVDGAQGAPQLKIDVQALNVDFYAFSGHKMLGPTGIGVLYGKAELLDIMPPVEFGGEMIDFVEEQSSTFKKAPFKFEGGTPNIAGAIGLGAAIDYLTEIGMTEIQQHDQQLATLAMEKLKKIDGLQVFGPVDPTKHAGIVSFNVDGIHPHDLATALDMEGVAIRAGHHCAQPLMHCLSVSATARASFYLYNSESDVDRLVESVKAAKEFFQV